MIGGTTDGLMEDKEVCLPCVVSFPHVISSILFQILNLPICDIFAFSGDWNRERSSFGKAGINADKWSHDMFQKEEPV